MKDAVRCPMLYLKGLARALLKLPTLKIGMWLGELNRLKPDRRVLL